VDGGVENMNDETVTGEVLEEVEPKRLPSFFVVRLDETTSYDQDALDRMGVRRVYGVYLYDESKATCCCEMTPSFCLYFVESCAEFEREPSDAARKRIEEWFREADTNSFPLIYVHCHDIEMLPLFSRKPWNLDDPKVNEMIADDEQLYENAIECLKESYGNNPAW
jgi:hypothetical protein